MAVRQTRMQANYINVGTKEKPSWAFCGAGFKKLNENPAAQTKSRRYKCDKSASKSITGYDWSTPFEIDQIRTQEAVNYIVNIGELQLTGDEAETEFLVVDLDKPIKEKPDTYYTRKFDVAVEVSSFEDDDGELTGAGNLLGIGDPVVGEFNTSKKEFTATTDSEE